MSDIVSSFFDLRVLDEFALRNTIVHRIHPFVKFFTTIGYLLVIVSFSRYEVIRYAPFFLYPAVLIPLSEIPVRLFLKRVLLFEPFILGIAILNPVFENESMVVAGFIFSKGWVVFVSIILKGTLTVMAVFVFVATTGIGRIGYALQRIKIPRIFILQIIMTYRYISLLMTEVIRSLRAYSLRSPQGKGIKIVYIGPFLGNILLRSFKRADFIYNAMRLRGFKGEFNPGNKIDFKISDVVYLLFCILYLVILKYFDFTVLCGDLIKGKFL